MKNQHNLQKNLKYWRNSRKLTQKQVAQTLGIDRSTYSYYEIGVSSPPVAGLIEISELFGVTIDELVNAETIKNRVCRHFRYTLF